MKKKSLLALSLLVLLLAVSLQAYIRLVHAPSSTLDGPLADLVPREVAGWQVRDRPLGQSKEAQAWTEKVLQYDDALFRTFTRGTIQLGIYAAYWQPGKKPYSQVGAHSPDSCWVGAGWQREQRIHAWEREIAGQPLKPVEYGVYSKDSQATEVIFWHLIGGQANHYQQKTGWRNGLIGRIERLPLFFKDLRTYGLDQQREQLFIRISSNVPFDQLWEDPAFITLFKALETLGLFA